MLARAVATAVGADFRSVSGSEFVEVFAGRGAGRVRELFRGAGSNSVVFIDEVDAVGRRRGGGAGLGSNQEQEQTLNQLLTCLDGVSSSGPGRPLVIAATNREELLDPALVRPGRFDRVVRVPLPDREGRLDILRDKARRVPSWTADLSDAAKRMKGASGADLEAVVNDAALRGAGEGVGDMEMGEAVDKWIQTRMGPMDIFKP